MSRLFAAGSAAFVAFAGVIGCTGARPDPGHETYQHYCVGCHGRSGEGDGPAAQGLPVKPADLSILREMNGGVFPTEHVMATVHGYPGKHDFAAMPEFGPLLNGPKQIWVAPGGEEIMTPVALVELAAYVETLQR